MTLHDSACRMLFGQVACAGILSAALGALGAFGACGASARTPIALSYQGFVPPPVAVVASAPDTGAGGDGVFLLGTGAAPLTWSLAAGDPGSLANVGAAGADFNSGNHYLYVPPAPGTLAQDRPVTVTLSSSTGASAAITIVVHPVPSAALWSRIGAQDSCEALERRACRGAFGFVMQLSGHYIAGPGPDGKTVEGQVSDAELAQLRAHADALAAAARADANGQCATEAVTVPGISHFVNLELAGDAATLAVRTTGRAPGATTGEPVTVNFCWFNGQVGATRDLLGDIDALKTKYYPALFEQ
jgi:hypothetical protein